MAQPMFGASPHQLFFSIVCMRSPSWGNGKRTDLGRQVGEVEKVVLSAARRRHADTDHYGVQKPRVSIYHPAKELSEW